MIRIRLEAQFVGLLCRLGIAVLETQRPRVVIVGGVRAILDAARGAGRLGPRNDVQAALLFDDFQSQRILA